MPLLEKQKWAAGRDNTVYRTEKAEVKPYDKLERSAVTWSLINPTHFLHGNGILFKATKHYEYNGHSSLFTAIQGSV